MAATINQSAFDTPKIIEDKVRDLPVNQGLNDNAMWALIDAEIAQSISDSKIKQVEVYPAAATNNKHGKK